MPTTGHEHWRYNAGTYRSPFYWPAAVTACALACVLALHLPPDTSL